MQDLYSRYAGRFALVLVMILTAGCEQRSTNLAMIKAQPTAPAQRNHTNFYPALQCMDALFVKAKRPRVMISANQIPDKTRSVAVDTRGMIITALNHMTRRSEAFAFVEQGLVGRTIGDTLALEKDNPKAERPPTPILYINGAISQVDASPHKSSTKSEISGFEPSETGLETATLNLGVDQSVVSLDLHLVSFPSRVVISGSAISNSITVSQKRWSPGLVGLISQRTLGVTFEIQSVESKGQAVRSLIELGLIEMLGDYSGVPFWECLSKPEVNAEKTSDAARKHMRLEEDSFRIGSIQKTLQMLGYIHVRATGRMDEQTRLALANFQAQQGILASGMLDFDTDRALAKARKTMQPNTKKSRTKNQTKTKHKENNGYQNLQIFVDNMF